MLKVDTVPVPRWAPPSGRHAVGAPPPPGSGRPPAFHGYVVGVGVIVVSSLISVVGQSVLHAAPFVLVFPVGVLLVAARFGLAAGVFTAVAGALAFDFAFVPPAMHFEVADLKDAFTLVLMLAVAVVASAVAEHLRRQASAAKHRAELEALRNALLSALSHDLRTPLTALVGAGRALDQDGLEPVERRAFSRMVAEESTRLSRLVGALLELTRLESGQVAHATPQAIDEVVGSALVRLEERLAGRSVHAHVPEATPLACFDPVLVEQVVVNLLENVVRHTPPGTPVDVSVRDAGRDLLLEVADRGPGVQPGDEERVFEKLHRGGANAGSAGSGLGLTICRAIMTAHGGRIWLENREGGGAVVRATLPVRGSPGAKAARLPRAAVDT